MRVRRNILSPEYCVLLVKGQPHPKETFNSFSFFFFSAICAPSNKVHTYFAPFNHSQEHECITEYLWSQDCRDSVHVSKNIGKQNIQTDSPYLSMERLTLDLVTLVSLVLSKESRDVKYRTKNFPTHRTIVRPSDPTTNKTTTNSTIKTT